MSKVVLVTGANRGLGFSVIEVSGLRYPSNTYILAARNLEDGKNAKAELERKGVKALIDVVQLDVTHDGQILALVEYVSTKYGKLDGIFSRSTESSRRMVTKLKSWSTTPASSLLCLT